MSSMRNAVQRRNHKERAQPEERKKWGLLEKHKDYSLRAKDFAKKKAHIRLLREKAGARNPDEFSFGMVNARSKGGVKQADRGNRSMSHEVVKLLKTQDQGYLRTMLQSVRNERRELEEGLVLGVDGVGALKSAGLKQGGHMVFVDGVEEQRAFDAGEWFGVEEGDGMMGRVWNRRRKGSTGVAAEEKEVLEDVEDGDGGGGMKRKKSQKVQDAEAQNAKDEAVWQRRKAKWQDQQLRKLEAVKQKEEDLVTADQELELQRARANHQIGGVNKKGVKFKIGQRRR
ncbi:U3 small nucleolar RNA-associated protein Utp11 [Pseudovirgaria hyperparasitica]|uniref:U3 small nucleolar RNA-associated protein 11 n=1 Tax=Pseudovirgaria hyperparasitica TaxID=470096 RepID=A0A6A6VTS0_9PEZI|nr:U3 small nucleolar RNA-associated protein Utp11 [Pseudovirgaria hyperparasitica]KAF2753124.1 U3 small nucleolar RNA-associated protein Utp11 [Pseudovirgaria hyperparasitica]